MLSTPTATRFTTRPPKSTTVTVRQLLASMQDLPANPTVAWEAIRLCDSARGTADNLADVIADDPAITAHAMRLANSAYYGLSRRVASAKVAVTVIGFSTVRSLATLHAAGLADGTPDGFWIHAAETAAAASLFAPTFGASPVESFSAGILHDIGDALLWRCAPDADPAPAEATDDVSSAEAGTPPDSFTALYTERAVFGIDHVAAAEAVLNAWRFPTDFVDAIARHHAPRLPVSPIARAVRCAEALFDPSCADLLATAGFNEGHIEEIRAQARTDGAAIAAGLTP